MTFNGRSWSNFGHDRSLPIITKWLNYTGCCIYHHIVIGNQQPWTNSARQRWHASHAMHFQSPFAQLISFHDVLTSDGLARGVVTNRHTCDSYSCESESSVLCRSNIHMSIHELHPTSNFCTAWVGSRPTTNQMTTFAPHNGILGWPDKQTDRQTDTIFNKHIEGTTKN